MALQLDKARLLVSSQMDPATKAKLQQYLTPDAVAGFMASLFECTSARRAALLDAGAGIGTLSAALLDRWGRGKTDLESVVVTAYEIDDQFVGPLSGTLARHAHGMPDVEIQVKNTDFIEDGLNQLQFRGGACFTHAILNPPYAKISSRSRTRKLLRCAGIETVNLYTGFVALALALLVPDGQLVAITPRSFCNGTYYRPFRRFILERAALTRIHLFGSRRSAFRDDDVLQENIVFSLRKGSTQNDVIVSTSTDQTMADYCEQVYPFDRIVKPGDEDLFIHVPTSLRQDPISASGALTGSLRAIKLQVSTGPVVDFRAQEYLRQMPEVGCVPLLYPQHLCDQHILWPRANAKKPNALRVGQETATMVFPAGHYVLVRRFSSKEETRRIVAAVLDPKMVDGQDVAIENHLNVFHRRKRGLDPAVAYGLVVYLNSTPVDELFRTFSGHTQVNVGDLERLPYPSRAQLVRLGRWAMSSGSPSQEAIDRQVLDLL